ncbi:SUMF1/EgtB/PvdO family nonheme iron enzyme [candidate division KSB1 bacterium]|nr:SUMF1/EgtB/PvdO family nonheme iron enzyme [candidate division KSB1 bacterium]
MSTTISFYIYDCCGGRSIRRVLRGGAFNNNPRNVRCANRNRNHPDNCNNNVGFRVVLSTLFKYAGISSWVRLWRRGWKNGRTCSWPRYHGVEELILIFSFNNR